MAYDKNTHHGYADQCSFWEMPISDIAALTGIEESTNVAAPGENRRFAHLMYQVNATPISGDINVDTNALETINADGFATLSGQEQTNFSILSGQQEANIIDANNTTTTTLSADGVFTGAWSDVLNYQEIRTSYNADVSGISCFLQFSPDGIIVERSVAVPPQANSLQTNFGGVHTLNPILPFFRVVYTNGSTAQTSFNLSVTLAGNSGGGLISRSNQVLNKYNDVNLHRITNDLPQDRNFGLIGYEQAKRVFGKNESVGNGALETIWTHSSNWVPLTGAECFRIASGGNANDVVSGTGARTIELTFLDENWSPVTEILTLSGATASAITAVSGMRLQTAIVKEVGTYHGSNIGDIIIEGSSTSTVVGHVATGIGTNEASIYSVPLGQTMYIQSINVSVGLT